VKSGAISGEVQGWIDLDKYWNATRDGLLFFLFFFFLKKNLELTCKVYEDSNLCLDGMLVLVWDKTCGIIVGGNGVGFGQVSGRI
jgi:hypothetical protein